MIKYRHVILDRDGVLNHEAPGGYVLVPGQWRWISGAVDALADMARAGIRLSVATNQSCVGRGLMGIDGLEKIHEKMKHEAGRRGIFFAGIYFCPHSPEHGCACRKPLPGLIEQAVADSPIPLWQTLSIGDSQTDLQAGQAAGIATWLVRTGKGRNTEASIKNGSVEEIDLTGVRVFNDLKNAAAAILSCHHGIKKD